MKQEMVRPFFGGFAGEIYMRNTMVNAWMVVEPYPSEKYDFVSWDDDIPDILWKHNPFMFETTNQ